MEEEERQERDAVAVAATKMQVERETQRLKVERNAAPAMKPTVVGQVGGKGYPAEKPPSPSSASPKIVENLCIRKDLNYPTVSEVNAALEKKQGRVRDAVELLKHQALTQQRRFGPAKLEPEPVLELQPEPEPEPELQPEPEYVTPDGIELESLATEEVEQERVAAEQVVHLDAQKAAGEAVSKIKSEADTRETQRKEATALSASSEPRRRESGVFATTANARPPYVDIGSLQTEKLSLEPLLSGSGSDCARDLPPFLQNVPSPSSDGAASPTAAVRREPILKARSQRMLLRQLNERRARETGTPVPAQLDYATVFHYALRCRRQSAQATGGDDLATLQVLERLEKAQGKSGGNARSDRKA